MLQHIQLVSWNDCLSFLLFPEYNDMKTELTEFFRDFAEQGKVSRILFS